MKQTVYQFRLLWVLWGINWKDEAFRMDLERWRTILHLQGTARADLAEILWTKPEFRNLLIYRNRKRPIFRRWVACIYPPMNTLFIEAGSIGGGLFIQHGFATMIAAQSIGKNCWINQQVTIGYRGQGRPPVIGDDVMITCGAKVLGSIEIGDGAIIGANAVVIRDVDAGATMAGVPARRIK